MLSFRLPIFLQARTASRCLLQPIPATLVPAAGLLWRRIKFQLAVISTLWALVGVQVAGVVLLGRQLQPL